MNEFQPIIDALQSKFPWLATVLFVIGALRIVAKPLSGWLQSLFTKLVVFVTGTPEVDDDEWLRGVLGSKIYRAIAFLVDLVASIKLPNSESLSKVQADEKLAQKFGVWLLIALCSFGLVATTGCGIFQANSAPPTSEAIKFYSFKDTWTAAHAGYKAYCELVVLGKVSKADEAEIDAAWNQFRAGFTIALKAAQNDWSDVTPSDVEQLKNDLITIIRSIP